MYQNNKIIDFNNEIINSFFGIILNGTGLVVSALTAETGLGWAGILFRGDDVLPETVKQVGFKSRGSSLDVEAHVFHFSNESGYIATSKKGFVGNQFAKVTGDISGKRMFVYVIDETKLGQKADVNAFINRNDDILYKIANNNLTEYKSYIDFRWQHEIAIEKEILPEAIVGAFEVNSNYQIIGDFIKFKKMEQSLLETKLTKFEYVDTWLAKKTYFIAATIKGKYEPCVIIFSPEPQSSGEIFLHQRGGMAAIPMEIDEIYESKFEIEPKILSLLIEKNKNPINYFVFEMNDDNMFNYCLKPSEFFINYPEGYNSRDVKKIYPNKIFVDNKLIDYDIKYKDRLTFYKAHDYIPSFL